MLISVLFLIIAILYSTVGFGGGSSYIAILALSNYPYESIPVIALICNLIVVSGGTAHYYKKGHLKWNLFWPFAISSIPLSFLGGLIKINKETFLILLGICLLLAGFRLLVMDRIKLDYKKTKEMKPKTGILIGGLLGLLSGLVGIGGGIFLAPILHTFRWGLPKQIAGTATLFIFINSITGLCGQLIKNSIQFNLMDYWPLFLAVFLGGQLGSNLGSGKFLSQRIIKNFTSLLVIYVGIKILFFN